MIAQIMSGENLDALELMRLQQLSNTDESSSRAGGMNHAHGSRGAKWTATLRDFGNQQRLQQQISLRDREKRRLVYEVNRLNIELSDSCKQVGAWVGGGINCIGDIVIASKRVRPC